MLDIFKSEFRAYSESYYIKCLLSGLLTVSGKKVDSEYIMTSRDYIEHKIIFIEAPMLDESIVIIKDSPDYIAVHKPASIPCHPQGKYRKCSVTWIIREFFLGGSHDAYLHPINRLDRTTSGVVILAKSAAAYKYLAASINEKTTAKLYLARTLNPIAAPPNTISPPAPPCAPASYISFEKAPPLPKHINRTSLEEILEPLPVVGDEKKENNIVVEAIVVKKGLRVNNHAEGQFLSVEYTDDEACFAESFVYPVHVTTPVNRLLHSGLQISVCKPGEGSNTILVRPRTGRTHQIRAHLALLGSPIEGDVTYMKRVEGEADEKESKVGIARVIFEKLDIISEQYLERDIDGSSFAGLTLLNEKGDVEVWINMDIVGELSNCLHAAQYSFTISKDAQECCEAVEKHVRAAKRQKIIQEPITTCPNTLDEVLCFISPVTPSWAVKVE